MAVTLDLTKHASSPRRSAAIVDVIDNIDQVATLPQHKLFGNQYLALVIRKWNVQLSRPIERVIHTLRHKLGPLLGAIRSTGANESALRDINLVPGTIQHQKRGGVLAQFRRVFRQCRAHDISTPGVYHQIEDIGLHTNQPFAGIGFRWVLHHRATDIGRRRHRGYR